jgi:23S rRNA pseudouridine2605 synthase
MPEETPKSPDKPRPKRSTPKPKGSATGAKQSAKVHVPTTGRYAPVRLNKHIAQSGLCSRREADELIAAGKVRINTQRPTSAGQSVIPATDEITVNGQPLPHVPTMTLLLHKPKDVLTTKSDERGRKTILDLLPSHLHSVDPAGRLDRDSTGALILTNDGDLLYQLTHPSYHVAKTYRVTVDHPFARAHADDLIEGILLKPENAVAKVDTVTFETPTVLTLTLHTGFNRQIRRSMALLGYKVTALKRTKIGGLILGSLPIGKYRFLKPTEINQLLKRSIYDDADY